MASTITREHLSLRKLLWVAPLTMLVTALANLIIRAIAVSFLGISGTFQYFQAPTIIGSTIFYLLLALLAFVLVSRFARHPVSFYRLLALIALLVSFLLPGMALGGLLGIAGMTLPIFWTMIAMHIVSAAIVVCAFTLLVPLTKN